MAKTMHVRTLWEVNEKLQKTAVFFLQNVRALRRRTRALRRLSAAAPGNSATALDLGSGSGRVGPPGRVGSDSGSGQTRKIKLKK